MSLAAEMLVLDPKASFSRLSMTVSDLNDAEIPKRPVGVVVGLNLGYTAMHIGQIRVSRGKHGKPVLSK